MRICIITPRFPFPENAGDVLRINGVARYLKEKGHTLILVSFVETDDPDVLEAEKLYDVIYTVRRKKWKSAFNSLRFIIGGKPIQCGYYYSRDFLKLLKFAISKESPDLFVCHLLRMVPYVKKMHIEDQTIVEMTDALSKTYSLAQKSKGFSIKKTIYNYERSLIKKYEKYVVENYRKVVLVSQSDVEYIETDLIKRHSDSLRVHTNGVDVMDSVPQKYDKNKICFVGNMRTLQNQEAALHFVNNIFPMILDKNPDAKFYIVGAQPSDKIKALASKNIIVTGFVDDICGYIKDSCVAVAPVHIAAGIQNKVLVSMGCGIPVILSSLISKAIPELRNKENCYIIDDDNEFANACLEFMQTPNLRLTVSENGYEMVKERYSWNFKLAGYEMMPNIIK